MCSCLQRKLAVVLQSRRIFLDSYGASDQGWPDQRGGSWILGVRAPGGRKSFQKGGGRRPPHLFERFPGRPGPPKPFKVDDLWVVKKLYGCVLNHTPLPCPRSIPQKNFNEMAFELVSGAEFFCKLMAGGCPVDLMASRGRFPVENRGAKVPEAPTEAGRARPEAAPQLHGAEARPGEGTRGH